MRLLPPSVLVALCVVAAPAGAATWTIGPDRCPAPALAAAYAPEASVISPDARDGVRPSPGPETDWWSPAALALRIPGGWPAVVWVDGELFDSGERTGDCGPVVPAPQ